MSQQVRDQNESNEKFKLESSHTKFINSAVKEGLQIETSHMKFINKSSAKEELKNIKVYIPAEGYDSKMSFEQNLAEGKVKLFSEMPANELNGGDPLKECLTFPLARKEVSQVNQNIRREQQNINDSTSTSDFDKLMDSSLQQDKALDENPHSYSNNSIDISQQSSSVQESEKHHSCDVCYHSFARRRDLALHYLTHTEKEKRRAAKKVRKCDICGNISKQCSCKSIVKKIYPNISNMPSSISLSQPMTSSTLFIQAESVSGNTSLIRRDLFHCPECEQTFGLESQLKQHILVHKRERARREKEDKSFDCNLCGQKFSDEHALIYHVSTVHPGNLQLVSNQISQESQNFLPFELQLQVCTSCRSIFNDVDSLRRHLKRLGWVCNVCSTYFCQKFDFQTHYLIHMDSNANKIVGNNSSNSLSATVHKKDVRELYVCCICNKKFKFLSLLKRHCSRHTLKNYHFCQWCKRKFKQKISAHVHYFSHNRKKNTCRICNKKFLLRKSLKIHSRTHE